MAERVQAWWARRQWSKQVEVPYEIGTYRDAWASFPALVRQYHPELNAGITLTQIPPAADVLLLWECDAGHHFVATPSEQRTRPGRERRRSAWCPDCTLLAAPPRIRPAAEPGTPVPPRRVRPTPALCRKTPPLPPGSPFVSTCAPTPASAVEARMRADLSARFSFDIAANAVTVARPFFQHTEVWPDIVIADLRLAIEFDSTGRHGLEHVGDREASDRRKDRALRGAGWEVVRVRTGNLTALGPLDVEASGWNRATLDRVDAALVAARGALLVDAYRR